MNYSNEELNDLMMSLHMFLALGSSPLVAANLRRRLENAIRQMEERIADLRSRAHQTESLDLEVARCYFNMHYMQRELRKLREAEE